MNIKSIYFKLLSIVLISGLGIIAYSNTVHCSFHFDDSSYIVENYFIRDIHNLYNIWQICPCRFITFYSLALNYHFHQLNLPGYHLFNLSVHLLTAILVWWLVLLTLSTPAMRVEKISQYTGLIALGAGLVFVSHPIQTEAVTYVWQRASSLAALFYLASLCFYVKARILQEDGRPSGSINFFYFFSLIITIAALFTKENTITLPLMMVLYEFCFLKGQGAINWKKLVPFLASMLIIPLVMVLTKSDRFHEIHNVIHGPNNLSPINYFFTQLRVILTYIRLAFLPLNQNVDYDYPIYKSIFAPPVLLSLIFLMAVLFIARRIFAKYRLLSFSIFWFFLTLVPESSFLPIEDVIFEHRLYLPLVGYSIFLTGGAYYLFAKRSLRPMVTWLAIIIAFYSILTYQRNRIWQDDFTLWSDSIKKSPHKARPYTSRAVFYNEKGNYSQAIADCNKAIELEPRQESAYNNRGLGLDAIGNYAQAVMDFTKAIELNPNFALAFNNRGGVRYHLGNYVQAISDYDRAIALDPNFAGAYNNRGFAYYAIGNQSQAIADFTKAIALEPWLVDAYRNRGFAYNTQKNYAQAILDLTRAIELDPKDASAYNNRGLAYNAMGNYDKVIADCTKAIELKPDYAIAYNNRALAYDAKGNHAQAIADYTKAIEINPKLAAAYYNLKKARRDNANF